MCGVWWRLRLCCLQGVVLQVGGFNGKQLNEQLLRLYHMLLYTLPGTPFTDYGDEIGLWELSRQVRNAAGVEAVILQMAAWVTEQIQFWSQQGFTLNQNSSSYAEVIRICL